MNALELDLAAIVGARAARDIVARLASMGTARYRVSKRCQKEAQIEQASALLASGMKREDVRRALMIRHDLSRRTAYRRIESALSAWQACCNEPEGANDGRGISAHPDG